jgi:hypothetical protein
LLVVARKLRRGLFVSELERAPRPAPPAAANVVRFSAGAPAGSVQNKSTKTDAATIGRSCCRQRVN